MKRISIRLGERSYEIVIGRNLLTLIGNLLRPLRLGPKVLVVTNRRIAGLFLAAVLSSLKRTGYDAAVIPYDLLRYEDERDKSEKTVFRLWQYMAKVRLDRSSTVLALGGGVVGDTAGFAASTYMRGISVVQVPTTLLAQVDAAIGGKTGINLASAKNIVGTFHQPRLVICDVNTLEKLPAWELRNGFAEVIKYGMIRDAVLFRLLEKGSNWFESRFLETVVARSARVKAKIVAQDERESGGQRMILNYGHTFAHAFEAASHYQLPHGEAVALGMVYAARLARRRGMLRSEDEMRQNRLIEKAGLPTRLDRRPTERERATQHMLLDKKQKNGKLRLILPETIGRVRVVENVSLREVKRVL